MRNFETRATRGTVIARPNRLRRYEIIINKQDIDYEKEFIACNCLSVSADSLRNGVTICRIRWQPTLPRQFLRQRTQLHVKGKQRGIQEGDRCPRGKDKGIEDISLRRKEGHGDDS